jgi:hypothetical protein
LTQSFARALNKNGFIEERSACWRRVACGEPARDWPNSNDENLLHLDAGRSITVPKILFPRIEEEQLQAWKLRFGSDWARHWLPSRVV